MALVEEHIRRLEQKRPRAEMKERDRIDTDCALVDQALPSNDRALLDWDAQLLRTLYDVRSRAMIVEPADDIKEVGLDTCVTFQLEGKPSQLRIVHEPLLVGCDMGMLSPGSDIGKAILGRAVGTEVEVRIPSGVTSCHILRAQKLRGVTTQ